MTIQEHLRSIKRHGYALVGLSLLAAILVFVGASLRDTTYTTFAVVGVTPGPVIAGNAVAVDTVSFTASRYERLVGSDAVLTSGAAVADKGTTLPDMRKRVSASTTAGSGTLTVTVKGSTADETTRVAAAVANATIAQGKADQEAQRNDSLTALRAERDALKAQLDQLAADAPERAQVVAQYQSALSDLATQQAAPYDAAQLLQTPEVPEGPVGPSAKSLAFFAFLAALVLGGEGIVIYDRNFGKSAKKRKAEAVPPSTDKRARSQTVARRAGGDDPLITNGSLSAKDRALDAAPVDGDEWAADVASTGEPFVQVPLLSLDELADTIRASALEGHRLVGIVGSGDLAATNDVALALGQRLADEGLSTLVVEGDMAHPALASRLSTRAPSGLTNVLVGGASLDRTRRQTTVSGLDVLPAGGSVETPSVLIGVDEVRRALSSSSSGLVLVSLPASMSSADRNAIAAQLDRVVLLVRDGRRRDEQVHNTTHDLGGVSNILLAVGLVDVVPNIEVRIIARKSERSPETRLPATVTTSLDPSSEPSVDEASMNEMWSERSSDPSPMDDSWWDDRSAEDVTAEDVTAEDVTSADVPSEDVSSEDVPSEDELWADHLPSQDLPVEESSSDDAHTAESPDEDASPADESSPDESLPSNGHHPYAERSPFDESMPQS